MGVNLRFKVMDVMDNIHHILIFISLNLEQWELSSEANSQDTQPLYLSTPKSGRNTKIEYYYR